MLNLRGVFAFLVGVALIGGGVLFFWHHGQPRRDALQSVFQLALELANPKSSELLKTVVIPASIQSQTLDEEQQFISKVLADEISPAGVLALERHAQFGSAESPSLRGMMWMCA
jgi:hypothetical protein